jgi:hypothetical protein
MFKPFTDFFLALGASAENAVIFSDGILAFLIIAAFIGVIFFLGAMVRMDIRKSEAARGREEDYRRGLRY